MRCLVFILGMRAGPRVLYLADAHIMESIISCLCKLEREEFKAEPRKRCILITVQRTVHLTHWRQVLCLSRFTAKFLQTLTCSTGANDGNWSIRWDCHLAVTTGSWSAGPGYKGTSPHRWHSTYNWMYYSKHQKTNILTHSSAVSEEMQPGYHTKGWYRGITQNGGLWYCF